MGRIKGGLNSKPHTVCDDKGRPIVMQLSEGQMSDHKGASLLFDVLPPVKTLIGNATRSRLLVKLKDWRRIVTRYNRCAHTFFSAICIAATVIFWL